MYSVLIAKASRNVSNKTAQNPSATRDLTARSQTQARNYKINDQPNI